MKGEDNRTPLVWENKSKWSYKGGEKGGWGEFHGVEAWSIDSCSSARTAWSVAIFLLFVVPVCLATCKEIKLHSGSCICWHVLLLWFSRRRSGHRSAFDLIIPPGCLYHLTETHTHTLNYTAVKYGALLLMKVKNNKSHLLLFSRLKRKPHELIVFWMRRAASLKFTF